MLSNAVEFTPNGRHVRLIIDKTASGGVSIAVSDSGAGIDASFLPHVLERFRQANGATTRSHAGLGLGLAIVKELGSPCVKQCSL